MARFRDRRTETGQKAKPNDGVDVSLIRWMLSLSPAERLQVLQSHVDAVTRLRRGRAKG